jgi:hypothetical protein
LLFEKKQRKGLLETRPGGLAGLVGTLNAPFLSMNYFMAKPLTFTAGAMTYYFLTTKTKEFNIWLTIVGN